MRSKTTLEFLGLWEKLHNPGFKGVEFDSFIREAGSNAFVLSPTKWIETTHAIGIISKPGNTGGTAAPSSSALKLRTSTIARTGSFISVMLLTAILKFLNVSKNY
jgi:hypothetical protein